MKFLKLKTDLTFEELEVGDYKSAYAAVRENVGGLIQMVNGYFDLPEGVDAWVNEEGLLLDGFEPVMVYHTPSGNMPLMGNVVFTRRDESSDFDGLTDEDIEDLKKTVDSGPFALIAWGDHDHRMVLFKDFC